MTDEEVKLSLMTMATLRKECGISQVLSVLENMEANDIENFDLFMAFNFSITQWTLYRFIKDQVKDQIVKQLMDTKEIPEC